MASNDNAENNYKTSSSNLKSGVCFSDVSHPKELLMVLNNLRSNEHLCDVTLTVGSLKISCHKSVLSASSPYFQAMFTGSLMESNLSEIKMHVQDEKAFSLVIDYFYTSKIDIKESNVQDLLPIAGMLQLKRLQQACCDFMKRSINANNCLGVYEFAESHSCHQLAYWAFTYSVSHFNDVLQSDEFCNISLEHVTKLLSDNSLNVPTEERVFEAAIAWIGYKEERAPFAAQVCKNVRFTLLSSEYLMDHVAKEDVIRECRKCSDLLLEAVEFLLLPKRRSASTLAQVLPRKAAQSQQVLYVIGGMSRREATRSAERYDPKEGRWKAIAEMSISRFGANVANLGSQLYVCGGGDEASRLNTAERYDPHHNVWIQLESMSSKRNGVGVAACGGKIYAIGGFDGSTPLSSAEVYDPRTMKWSQIASMSQARFGVGCCVLNEEIYAIGGSDGSNLRSCEKYDPEKNLWVSIASMSVARKQVACAAMGDSVYAIGGSDMSGSEFAGRYQTVERYNPSTDQWVMVAPLLSPRSGAGAGVLDGILYVCGGFDGQHYLNTVEKYDPLTNRWQVGPPMIQSRDCVAVCVASYKKNKRIGGGDLYPRSSSPSLMIAGPHTN